MSVTISGRPSAESTHDGISHLADEIAGQPAQAQFIVMEVLPTKIAHPVDEKGELGDVAVTLRPVHIEVATSMEDQAIIMGLLQRRHLDRTGQDRLALEDPSAASDRDEAQAARDAAASVDLDDDVTEADRQALHKGVADLLDSSTGLADDGTEAVTCPNCGAGAEAEHAAGCPSGPAPE